MKILCVIDDLGSGGAQRQLVNLAVGFKERGHDVSFLVYHSADFFQEILKKNNITIYEIIESSYLKRFLKMRRFIRNGNFDSVLSFLEAANFICELAGLPWRRWKLVVGERSAKPAILKSFKLRFYRWFHLLADYVVANSHENLKMVRKINPLLPSKKCKVIYNLVDFEKWKPDSVYTYRYDGKFRLVVAASHQYLKNLNGLIRAVDLLSAKEKEQLVVEWYGDNVDGKYFDNSYPEALELIDKLNLCSNFNFYPATHNLPKVFKTANAVGIFSFYEGLPNTVCETMVAGKPVIASDVSDIKILINNENLICNPNNLDSIKTVLSYLISCTEQTLIEISNKNKILGQSLFNANKNINEYLRIMV